MSPRSKVAISIAVTVGVFAIGAGWCFLWADVGSVGNLLPTLVLFPFGSAVMAVMTKAGIAGESLYQFRVRFIPVLAALQFAIYGTLVGRAWLRNKAKKAAAIVCGVHASAALFSTIVFFQR